MISSGDYEIVSPPENETPRELVKRVTGNDVQVLEGVSWDALREHGLTDIIANYIMKHSKPSIMIKPKKENS